MARLFFIILCFFPIVTLAQGSIDAYVPPAMFEPPHVSDAINEPYPPLPPKRPNKLKVSKKYAAHMRKYGKAPDLPAPKKVSASYSNASSQQADAALDNLIEPTAEDILKQINPQ